MKNLIYILMFYLNGLCLYSQGFINQYNLNSYLDDRSFQVEATSYGYLIYGFSRDSINGSTFVKLSFLGTDPAGNILFKKSIQHQPDTSLWIGANSLDMYSNLLKVNTNFYIIATEIHPPGYIIKTVVCKLTEFADTVWKKEYSDGNNSLNVTSINKADHHNFILSCWNQTPSNDRTLILIKIDSTGNELWRQYYDTKTAMSHFSRNTIYHPLSKHYYFCIETQVGGLFVPFIYICDSMGVKIDQKQMSPVAGFGGDGKLGLLSDHSLCFFGYEVVDSVRVKNVFLKVDTSGQTLVKKLYGKPSPGASFTDLIELPNHTYVLSGTICDTIYYAPPFPPPLTAENNKNWNGTITQLDSNGNLKWQSIIDISFIDIFMDIVLAPNKGYAVTGYLDYNLMFPNDHQKFLLVVTDSLGCQSNMCVYTGVNGPADLLRSNYLMVYPNPFFQFIHLELSHSSEKINEIAVYNLLGELVLQKKENTTSIDLSSLRNDVYILEVKTKNQTYRKKIIKN